MPDRIRESLLELDSVGPSRDLWERVQSRSADTPPPGPDPRRGRILSIVVAAVVALAGLGLLVRAITTDGTPAPTVTNPPPPTGVPGPDTSMGAGQGLTTTTVRLPGPVGQAFAAGSLWVVDHAGVVRLDPSGRKLATVPGVTGDIAGDGDGVWTVTEFGELTRIDPRTAAAVAVSRVPVNGFVRGIAAGEGHVWVATQLPVTILDVDAATGAVLRSTELPCGAAEGPAEVCEVHDLVADGSGVLVAYAIGDHAVVARVDAAGHVIEGPSFGPPRLGLATGLGSVWVAGAGVDRLDPTTLAVTGHADVRGLDGWRTGEVAVGGGSVWAVVREDGRLSRIDRSSMETLWTLDAFGRGASPGAGALTGTREGVALIGEDRVLLIDTRRSPAVRATTACGFPALTPTDLPWLQPGEPIPAPGVDRIGGRGNEPQYSSLSWVEPGATDRTARTVTLWRTDEPATALPRSPHVPDLPGGSIGGHMSEGVDAASQERSIVWWDGSPRQYRDTCDQTTLSVSLAGLSDEEALREILKIARSLVPAKPRAAGL